MNSFELAVRSVVRKPVKSMLLFLIVFTISLFLLSGMASKDASIATQDKARQAIGAGFLLAENEANRHIRIDEVLNRLGKNTEGSLDGVHVEKMELAGGTSWGISTDNSFETLQMADIEKIASVPEISDYNITTAVTAVNPVNFSRIEDDDTDQSSDMGGVSLIGNKKMEMDSNVLSGNVTIKEGRMIQAEDSDVCVISKELAEKNHLSLGDRLTFNDYHDREHSTVCEASIVGIYEVKQKMTPYMSGDTYRSENVIFTDLDFPEKAEGNKGNPLYEKAYFKVRDVDQYDSVKEIIRKVEIDWERYDLIDHNGNLDIMSSNFNDLEKSSQILIFVVLGSSCVILILVFLFWMKNRGKEIGIFLALGTPKIKILGQILLEAMLIATMAMLLSFALAPGVSKVAANYLVEQQVQQEKEQDLLDEGKVAKPFEELEQTVTGVTVDVSLQMLLFDSICISILIIFSVGVCGILVIRRNPKDIFSEMS
ncbi:MAG: ABC transporter permease [Lachnospiraceae bacterium]|nr:ABC transporter permease [Lachnospiraceae bacterium]